MTVRVAVEPTISDEAARSAIEFLTVFGAYIDPARTDNDPLIADARAVLRQYFRERLCMLDVDFIVTPRGTCISTR